MTPEQKKKFENDLRILRGKEFDVYHVNEPNGQINVLFEGRKYAYWSGTGRAFHAFAGVKESRTCKTVFDFIKFICDMEAVHDAGRKDCCLSR